MSVTVAVSGLDPVMLRLHEMPDCIRRNLAAVCTSEAIRLEGVVKADKLSGQVLKNRTGRLRSSIHHQMAEIGSDSVTAGVYANMSEAAYARFWEYGFVGTEQVREHLSTMTQAFGRLLETPREVLVKAHARKVDQPARSFLGSTLEENRQEITDRLLQAVQLGLDGEQLS